MAPSPPRLRILSVGSNAVSGFLSWRLQATNSCDVTLVWKSGFEAVAQYGVTFRSKKFGNERFKPRHVVRTPEEAASRESAFDYVILCVKALPDVYDIGSVIESVVTPQHTCILVNTTNTLGIESQLEQRFPTNVVLSLVSNLQITQVGPSEFEHDSSCEILVGPSSQNPSIPAAIQNDMASALAITLGSGQVDCKVSPNIKQQQFDHMIGPIAFHPPSVLFDTPNHAQLLEKVGLRQLVNDVIDELIQVANAQGCSMSDDYREKTVNKMTLATETQSTMYQDYVARRPMEVETYLGSPIKLAMESGVRVPRIETLYAMLHHLNIMNQTRPQPSESPPSGSSSLHQPPPRTSSIPLQRPMNGMNGTRASRTPSAMGIQPPGARRGPPMGGPVGGPMRIPSGQPSPNRLLRDASFEGNNLEEFSHLVVYDDVDGDPSNANGNGNGGGNAMPSDLAVRERELALRQRELQLRERELMAMRRGGGGGGGGGGRRGPPRPPSAFDEEDEDFFDPNEFRGPPNVDPESIDMMSVTSRRARKAFNANQLRKNVEMNGSGNRPPSSFNRYFGGRKNPSSRLISEIPTIHGSLLDDPMMGYSSNRYGSVDRKEMHIDSRANSLTASRMGDYGPGPYPPSRRVSQSPAVPFNGGPPGPGGRGMSRPPTGLDGNYGPPNGMMPNGRPSSPMSMRAPVPRYPGQGNMNGQNSMEHLGVSNSYPVKHATNVRGLTGSASASAGSGDSGASANIDSENSAHSSRTSLGPHPNQPLMLVR